VGSPVQVRYDEGWFDGAITSFERGVYTVTMIEDGDAQVL